MSRGEVTLVQVTCRRLPKICSRAPIRQMANLRIGRLCRPSGIGTHDCRRLGAWFAACSRSRWLLLRHFPSAPEHRAACTAEIEDFVNFYIHVDGADLPSLYRLDNADLILLSAAIEKMERIDLRHQGSDATLRLKQG